MKKSLMLLALLLSVSIFTIASVENESVVGSWEFSNPQAPWEYNKGSFNFMVDENDAYVGAIEFHTGQEIPMQKVTVEGEKVFFDVNVEGSVVNADCMIDENTMTCDVLTMQGTMKFQATRMAEEEE